MTARYPIPRLNTRRSSSSATCRASQAKTGRPLPRVPVDLRAQARRGATRARFPRIPPPVTCAKRVRASRSAAHVLEVEPRRREQVVTRVVLVLEHAPHEREAVRVHAGRREADHGVALLDRRAVDQPRALDEPDARPGEVELAPRGRCPGAQPSRRRRARRRPHGRPRQHPRRGPRPARGRSGSPRRSRGRTADRRRT